MLQFFKYTLATIVGLILFFLLFFFIMVGVASGLSKKSAVEVKQKTVLLLDFKGVIMERAAENPWAKIQGDDNVNIGLNIVIENIRKAKEDANISGSSQFCRF